MVLVFDFLWFEFKDLIVEERYFLLSLVDFDLKNSFFFGEFRVDFLKMGNIGLEFLRLT